MDIIITLSNKWLIFLLSGLGTYGLTMFLIMIVAILTKYKHTILGAIFALIAGFTIQVSKVFFGLGFLFMFVKLILNFI